MTTENQKAQDRAKELMRKLIDVLEADTKEHNPDGKINAVDAAVMVCALQTVSETIMKTVNSLTFN